MSLWKKLIGLDKSERVKVAGDKRDFDPSKYVFIDIETGVQDRKIHDIGAVRYDNAIFHDASVSGLLEFIENTDFICGHNIVNHDLKILFPDNNCRQLPVDTLYFSPLLFPERPYHRLVKDYKLISEQSNNPVNDCEVSKELLFDEINQWNSLPGELQTIYSTLLGGYNEFDGFLKLVNAPSQADDAELLIRDFFNDRICQNADLDKMTRENPVALAYALALIGTSDYRSTTPGWVLNNFPEVEYIIKVLCNTPCRTGCKYCDEKLDIHKNLKRFFGFDKFRIYGGEPLQENAVKAASEGKSLLAIFPTGGGKSLTFQLPALMEGHTVHGLTVVISPLQSLMKDQVDNLADRGITDAVTINGLADPISRAESIRMVQDGEASLLYISPEMLRSKTIERILLCRNVVRFVIDEAHCFSSWGQDFRVDYLYIGKFIKNYQEKKRCRSNIPVSCFTATAKQKVIQDICDYFKSTLGINMELYASTATRTNLQYSVIHADDDNDKYSKLRALLSESTCPTIVYVSRTKRTRELSAKLNRDGISALPFNGKMKPEEKIANQESFMEDRTRVIVATSAFGMGVDKKDVGLVIHYDISDSLENYVQEAGRAGRDPSLQARCFVLYSDNDLDKHFILLNQTKLSLSEIQQVWKAIKDLTGKRMSVSCSALEIARQAGWDDSVTDIETRVKTAVSTLEQGGYLIRGNNIPHVYATGITVKNLDEARQRITSSNLFGEDEVENAVRVIKSLISNRHIAKAQDTEAESRIDYLADILGLSKWNVISAVERMRQEGILADSRDISAFLSDTGATERRSMTLLDNFAKLEQYILNNISEGTLQISCKQLNDNAVKSGIKNSTEKSIRTLLYFLSIKSYLHKKEDQSNNLNLNLQNDFQATVDRFEKRIYICRLTIEWLYRIATSTERIDESNNSIQFSVIELLNYVRGNSQSMFRSQGEIQLEEVEEALLYLSKIGALKLEGGFLVIYNAMKIERLKDNKARYRQDDYRMLNEFYKLKIQQIHIVGEYANLMVQDYNAALQFVQDYFVMDYRKFISKYFRNERVAEIQQNVTPAKYKQLFGSLSPTQKEIISDKSSRCIVVAAGPGSGKTRVLVHKLASLLLMEDVKHEQLLMLTFSRAAATEFKQRLMGLIGRAAHFVDIMTFHSYSFDLLGRVGNLDDADSAVASATRMINDGEVEPNKIRKTVLVIDEAQDMSAVEFEFVKALISANEDMRIIAVGDDDQNIYDFRGANSGYMFELLKLPNSRMVEMTENYRSASAVVDFANSFTHLFRRRMKQNPLFSMNGKPGEVNLTLHSSKLLYEPVVTSLLNNKDGERRCVLTQTNEEAVIINALLQKNGINSRLIQSLGSLKFRNVAEIRYFKKYISRRISSPVISQSLWDEAKAATMKVYGNSACISCIANALHNFEAVNDVKYFTDFKDFIYESKIEDFYDDNNSDVVVSTIHKAKGTEFDNVFIMLSDFRNTDDSQLRRVYVGATRAKSRLFIHTNSTEFNGLKVSHYHIDKNDYAMPEDVALQLGHKDVYLSYFKERKNEILSLKSGDNILYRDYTLYNPATGNPVGKLSKRMIEVVTGWESKGYVVESAKVRFIVAWKEKDAPKENAETAIILADLSLHHK